jgi:hypothetical protein
MGLEGGGLADLTFLTNLVSGGGRMASSFSRAGALSGMGRYEGQLAKDQAALLDIQARQVVRQGDERAGMVTRDARLLAGKQAAAAAGQGVDVTSGTAALIQEQTMVHGALDAETERNNAWREAWGLRAEAQNVRLAGQAAQSTRNYEAGATAATGGYQFGVDLLRAADLHGQMQLRSVGNPGSSSIFAGASDAALYGAQGGAGGRLANLGTSARSARRGRSP